MTWDISISEFAAPKAPWTAASPVGRGPTKSRHCHWSARPAAGPPASFSAGMMIWRWGSMARLRLWMTTR